MARVYARPKFKKNNLESRMESWIRGYDTLVSNTQIRADELSEASDIILIEDGKIQCPRDGQTYYKNSSGSRVTGLFPYYKSDGTKKLLRSTGTTLRVLNTGTNDWDAVSGYSYTTGLNTNGVMAYDRLYLVNGTDPLTYFDGSVIQSFTAISAPTSPSVTRTGSSGSYTFSYKVTAVTSVGETTPTAAATSTLNQATLDNTNYMTFSWTAATSAIGYNVYGRKDGSWYFLKYLEGNSSTSYIDKGTDTPSEVFTPPESNTTGGPIGKYIALYKDTIFILGDPSNPSRAYYSGGGDKINDFSMANGGGFIDIAKNDGQVGTGMIMFKNSLLIFKEESIYQFSFTTSGLPQVEQVSASLGCIAPRSLVQVENDIFFASRRGIFTIGNEAGFAFDVLRTNELTSRIRAVYKSIDPAYIENIAAIYVSDQDKNLVIFSYTEQGSTTNAKAIVYDRERLGWYKWTNIQANCWTSYRESDDTTVYLYGDDSSGYVKRILSGSDDFGSAIHGYFRLKAESFKELERYKTLKNIHVMLRRPSGTIICRIIKDGVTTEYTANIGTVSPSINFGHYTFTDFLLGESYGTGVSEQDNNIVRRLKNLNLLGRSFLLEFDNNQTGASFTLLGIVMEAKAKSRHFYGENEVVTIETSSGDTVEADYYRLLEDGTDKRLLESGDYLLLQG